jgi:Ca-activated chloride channel family protein
MPERFQVALADAVRTRGLGLVFSGGKASFGTGGYEETTLASLLPVEFSQHTEKRDPSTALALIIDTSTSMGGARIDLAKQVARLAARRLKAHDRIGIVEFYGNKHWALPMQSAANKISIDRAIGRMQAAGGTVLYPAIEEAYYGLRNVAARYKHIIIITDAGVEENDYESMLRRISKDRINVSTVLVGAQAHNQKLIDLANWGKGRFYSASNRYALPEVILKQPSTLKLPAYKTGAFTVSGRGGSGWWDRVDPEALPAVAGYVETTSRPGAEVVIELQENAHPILASWHYGLGRVTALMTEPVGLGTTMWQNWHDYGRMLGRVVSRTADDSRAFSFTIKRNDHLAIITARRNSRATHMVPQATVLDAQNGELDALRFRQLTPDYFAAQVPVDSARELRIDTRVAIPGNGSQPSANTRLVSNVPEGVAAEKQVDPAMALDLPMLSGLTGGYRSDLEGTAQGLSILDEGHEGTALRLIRLWPFVLLLALLTYLSELIYRRWPGT